MTKHKLKERIKPYIKHGAKKLKHGDTTDIFFDLLPMLMNYDIGSMVYLLFHDYGIDYIDVIAGAGMSGSIMVSGMVGYAFGGFILREDGKEESIGTINPGDRVLIVDDVCTTGKTLDKIEQEVLKRGGVVVDKFVIVNRGDYPCKYLFDMNEFTEATNDQSI